MSKELTGLAKVAVAVDISTVRPRVRNYDDPTEANYREAVNVANTSDWWRSLAVKLANGILSPPAAGPGFDFDADFVTEMKVALTQLDELAHQWGDEGKFRGVRDRMRKAFKAFAEKHTSAGLGFDAEDFLDRYSDSVIDWNNAIVTTEVWDVFNAPFVAELRAALGTGAPTNKETE
jgi:hypothetical protein